MARAWDKKKFSMPDVAIEKIVFGGQGLGRIGNKVAFVWNALPGETVEADILKNRKTHLEAVATRIIVPSPDRTEPLETHFLSCSPWQSIAWEKENEWKVEMATEAYEKIGRLTLPAPLEIKSQKPITGYRNKMEYSFAEAPDGAAGLAFFDRGGRVKRLIPGCVLADPAFTPHTKRILAWINAQNIPMRSLKTLVVRSNRAGEVIAGLFLKDRMRFNDLPPLGDGLLGFLIYYSTHQSPASVPTEPLQSIGEAMLAETIRGKKFQYGLFSFFQVNLPIFETTLEHMARFLPDSAPLLDYYSGVGSIGIALDAPKGSALVDSNAEAIAFAQKNLALNGMTGVEAVPAPAEKMTDLIDATRTLIMDPPRAGLHARLIQRIDEQGPKRVLYLSCNIATQARDLNLLSSNYHLSHISLYNFFPRTPHIEALAVLDRQA